MAVTRERTVAADQDQDILDCIARADKKAGGDNAAFVRFLNE